MKKIALIITLVAVPALVFAQTPVAPEQKAPAPAAQPEAAAPESAERTFEVVELKFCTGVQDKEPIDNKTDFGTGDRAWLWLKLIPKTETATVSMKWSWNDNHVWTMEPQAVRLGRTWYYKTIDQPGTWTVELVDDNGNTVESGTLTAVGEPVQPGAKTAEAADTGTTAAAAAAPAATPTTAGGEAPAEEAVESAHLGVIELKLAEEIKDREPVNPGTTFATGSKVFTWLKLNVKDSETQIRLRWFLNDTAIYTSDPIEVKQSPGWRTWIYKTVDVVGAWKVEVLDVDEKAVYAQNFSVQ